MMGRTPMLKKHKDWKLQIRLRAGILLWPLQLQIGMGKLSKESWGKIITNFIKSMNSTVMCELLLMLDYFSIIKDKYDRTSVDGRTLQAVMRKYQKLCTKKTIIVKKDQTE